MVRGDSDARHRSARRGHAGSAAEHRVAERAAERVGGHAVGGQNDVGALGGEDCGASGRIIRGGAGSICGRLHDQCRCGVRLGLDQDGQDRPGGIGRGFGAGYADECGRSGREQVVHDLAKDRQVAGAGGPEEVDRAAQWPGHSVSSALIPVGRIIPEAARTPQCLSRLRQPGCRSGIDDRSE